MKTKSLLPSLKNLLLAIMLQDGAKLLTLFVATARDAIH